MARAMWFYAVQAGDGAVKFGRTVDVTARVAQLAIASPAELRLVAAVPETVIRETDAKRQWADLRVRGEWYKPDPGLIAWLARLPALWKGRTEVIVRRPRKLAPHSRFRPRRCERIDCHKWYIPARRKQRFCSARCRHREWIRSRESLAPAAP